MKKPVPYIEMKQIMNLIDMQHWIDEKYQIDARDYAGRYNKLPNWPELVASQGISLERATELERISPVDVTDPAEKAAMQYASEKTKEHMDNTPYQDFWHFQLELFNNFSNHSYQTFHLGYQMTACQEDWQREIAQMWLDEFGEFMDEHGDITVWVSW